MKYGFIGCGNMAGAIVKGCIRNNAVDPREMFIYDADPTQQEARIKAFGMQGCDSIGDLIASAEGIFIGVKPNVLPELLPVVGRLVAGTDKLLISMAAGQFLYDIETMLNVPSIPIIRIMPNLNAEVGAGMTAMCKNDHVSRTQYEEITSFFNMIGMAMDMNEKEFPVFTAIASCSPAFTFLYIDSLAKGAQKLGMNKKRACAIAAQAVMGSARLLLESDAHPWELIDSVCSPGGTTIEGICSLESSNFQSALVSAVEAVVKKDAALTQWQGN